MDDRIIFPAGSMEIEYFLKLLLDVLEDFTGIRVIAYALMGTHYHVECEVPPARVLSDEELLGRIERRYGVAERESIAEKLRWSPRSLTHPPTLF
jgi:hypothetical protein